MHILAISKSGVWKRTAIVSNGSCAAAKATMSLLQPPSPTFQAANRVCGPPLHAYRAMARSRDIERDAVESSGKVSTSRGDNGPNATLLYPLQYLTPMSAAKASGGSAIHLEATYCRKGALLDDAQT
jgi:hypothetical protein